MTRATQTYGLDLADLEDVVVSNPSVGVVSAAATLEAYVDWLFAGVCHYFSRATHKRTRLERFASRDVVDALVAEQRFLSRPNSWRTATRLTTPGSWSRAWRRTNTRVLAKALNASCRVWPGGAFQLVKQRYFESTISRMVAKGQSEAALRYAGEDQNLRRAVIQRLVQNGDAVTASEPRQRSRLRRRRSSAAEELARAAATRRDAHLQLPDGVARAVVFVDDVEGLTRAHVSLRRAKVIGLDTEGRAARPEDGGGGEATPQTTRTQTRGDERGRRRREQRCRG